MEKYYVIHIILDNETNRGYSIYVIANSEEDALEKAKKEELFTSEYDFEDVDYIEEINEEEYKKATNYRNMTAWEFVSRYNM